MPNSTLNPIEKLTQLCAQRTTRTDRLHAVVRTLTDALETAGCRPGQVSVTVDGWTLVYSNVRSNVGVRDCWSLRGGEHGEGYCTDLALDVDHEGYLHGDFNQPIVGPKRAHLIAFGTRAERFVAEIIAKAEASVARIEAAEQGVETAMKAVVG
jgi:hypothetical protein